MRYSLIAIIILFIYSCNSSFTKPKVILNEYENSSQILIENSFKMGEGVFSCESPKKDISYLWQNDTLVIKYPIETKINQKITSSILASPSLIIKYKPFSKTTNIDSFYKDLWCTTFYLDTNNFDTTLNKTEFIKNSMLTLNESCLDNDIYMNHFHSSVSHLMEYNPYLFVNVLDRNEMIKKELFYTVIKELKSKKKLLKKFKEMNESLYSNEDSIRDRIISILE